MITPNDYNKALLYTQPSIYDIVITRHVFSFQDKEDLSTITIMDPPIIVWHSKVVASSEYTEDGAEKCLSWAQTG